jgi:uncharacterized short protein YbdD (DUF466 family)
VNPIRALHWYLRELTDESAYDRYVEHLRVNHPGRTVPSRREFEWRRQDAMGADPRARCC